MQYLPKSTPRIHRAYPVPRGGSSNDSRQKQHWQEGCYMGRPTHRTCYHSFLKTYKHNASIFTWMGQSSHRKKYISYILFQNGRWFMRIQIGPCCLVQDKIFFWILSVRTRHQGLIWIKTKEYLNGGHFGIRCIQVELLHPQIKSWASTREPTFWVFVT